MVIGDHWHGGAFLKQKKRLKMADRNQTARRKYLMSQQNRIIIPANYSIKIEIGLDPNNGQTELKLINRSGKNISMLQIAALLAEHNSSILKSLLTGTTKIEKIADPATPAEGQGNN